MAPPRLASLDYIRGLAVLGILAVNAAAFATPLASSENPALWPFPLSQADLWVWWSVETFFQGKFYTLFALLFGVSLYLVGKAVPPQTPLSAQPLFRRLLWLMVFGLIHGALIWWGDILLMYAVVGFVFWRWREASGRQLLIGGAVLWLVGSGILAGLGFMWLSYAPALSDMQAPVQAQTELMRSGFMGSLRGNYAEWSNGVIFSIVIYIPKILGLMMLGLGLFKTGFFEGRYPAWPFLLAGSVALGFIGTQALSDLRGGFASPAHEAIAGLANEFLSIAVSLGYAAGLMALGKRGLSRFLEPVGRMAFTNYLTQSLIMTGLFYGGRGPGLFGTMGYVQLLPIVVGIWLLQIAVSHLWLRYFRYGPFEWLWRSLTFGRFISLR